MPNILRFINVADLHHASSLSLVVIKGLPSIIMDGKKKVSCALIPPLLLVGIMV